MLTNIPIPTTEISAFCRQNQITELAVFGSILTDRFNAESSDIDLLVTFAPEAQVGLLAFNRIRRELSELLKYPVDLVPRAGLKSAIRQSVLDSAEVVYAAG